MHCWRPTSRLNNKISEHISASVTPLHVCLEEQRGPELGSCESTTRKPRVKSGQDNLETKREARNADSESGSGSTVEDVKQNHHQSMANTISNMKMTNPIKELVSKRRKRFTADGFNLDLTYIRDNLIAMGFPAEKLEGVYRNHIDDVVKFLESKHKDHYKIYNLCKERSYDRKKFKERVATYAFDDHNPPTLDQMKPFCEDVETWLSQNSENVAVVHCKAGKGRTGVMVCCYLLHSRQFLTASEALNYYGTKRTHDRKGVTIPSQRRYVGYYATLVQEGLMYQPVTLILKQIKLEPVPILNGGQGILHFVISEANDSSKLYSSDYEVKKGVNSLCISLDKDVALRGDIRVDFYNKPNKKIKKKEKLFHFWFNTYFVRDQLTSETDNGQVPVERSTRALSCDGTAMEMPTITSRAKARTGSLASLGPMPPSFVLSIDKWNLDDAHKDKNHKLFNADFKVNLIMHRDNMAQPKEPNNGEREPKAPSESSETESSDIDTTGDEDGWDSGESTYL